MTAPMFVIVRHGNTFGAGEQPRRIGAATDLPLTPTGLRQAEALGELFAANGWHFGRVLVSPLQRTRQTAAAIVASQPFAPDPQPAQFLCEIDHGADENQTEDEVLARIGRAALAAWDDHAVPPPGWVVNSDERIDSWRHLFASIQVNEAPILLVTSNGAARFALMADPALSVAARNLPSLKLPTGGYGVIGCGIDGTPSLVEWGARP